MANKEEIEKLKTIIGKKFMEMGCEFISDGYDGTELWRKGNIEFLFQIERVV